ncbi:acyl carrier protein [Pantoea sp. Eser]|nr:acyl carrier protein [Pantoea sp. Eser]
MDSLINDIKQMIIDTLNLEDIRPADIDTEAPLFGKGLDSIDVLELGLAVKNRYGVAFSADSETLRAHFLSVASLAAFVDQQRA